MHTLAYTQYSTVGLRDLEHKRPYGNPIFESEIDFLKDLRRGKRGALKLCALLEKTGVSHLIYTVRSGMWGFLYGTLSKQTFGSHVTWGF